MKPGERTYYLSLYPPDSHRHMSARLPCDLWPRDECAVPYDFRLRTVRKFEGKVLDQNRQRCLSVVTPFNIDPPGMKKLRALNSAATRVSAIKEEPLQKHSPKANDFPRHVLGPSRKVSRWRWPWISFARKGSLLSVNHRSGSNSFAFGPQNTSDLLMHRIGTATMDPFGTKMRSTTLPDAVVIGSASGMTSSTMA